MKLPTYLLCCLLSFSACQQGAAVNELPFGYEYVDRGGYLKEIYKSTDPKQFVLARVIQYKYNMQFLLILQEPILSEHLNHIASDINATYPRSLTSTKDSVSNLMHMRDSIMQHDPYFSAIFRNKYNFWIATPQKLFGPYNFDEYYKKRIELGVPEGLKLEI